MYKIVKPAEYKHPTPKKNIMGIILSGDNVSRNRNTQNKPLIELSVARNVSATGCAYMDTICSEANTESTTTQNCTGRTVINPSLPKAAISAATPNNDKAETISIHRASWGRNVFIVLQML